MEQKLVGELKILFFVAASIATAVKRLFFDELRRSIKRQIKENADMF